MGVPYLVRKHKLAIKELFYISKIFESLHFELIFFSIPCRDCGKQIYLGEFAGLFSLCFESFQWDLKMGLFILFLILQFK